MAATTWATGAGSSTLIIAADTNRDRLTIQLHDTDAVFLGFGEAAANLTGIKLIYPGCSVRITGAKARLAVYGYSAAASFGGVETMHDVEYRPGSYMGL